MMRWTGERVRLKNNTQERNAQKSQGQALVEFALIVPLLLLLVFGIVEFGRIFSAGLIVNYSAREGARLGIVGATDSEITARARDSAPILDSAELEIDITPAEDERERGEEIRVRVAYPVEVITPFISVITGDVVTVEGISVMRVE